MILLHNFTQSTQQVFYINGNSSSVGPGEEIEIDIFTIFPEEYERLTKFFEMSRIEIPSKARRVEKTIIIDGGN